jgi:hypothetical protein
MCLSSQNTTFVRAGWIGNFERADAHAMSADLSAQHTPAVSAAEMIRLLAECAVVRVRLVLSTTCGFMLYSVFWYDFVHETRTA